MLGAAQELFAERGLEVTLDDVARRAGVGVGTAYRRFANRTALIEAVLDSAVEDVVELAEEALAADLGPWKAFEQFFLAASTKFAGNRGLRELLFDGGSEAGAALSGVRERLSPAVDAILTRARDAGELRADLDHTDFPMLQIMLGAVTQRTRDFSPEIWRRYAVLLLDGLRAARDISTPLPEGAPAESDLLDQASRS
nr:TetR/AcrR family transcriptional regulator [Nesterenkonia xinjiangensis]